MWSQIPHEVKVCCKTISRAGYEAYLVGGAVRDLLLFKTPTDFDLATSAPPEKIMALFARTIPLGIKHGTVTVFVRSVPIEVTSFRLDGDYSDGRRPDFVSFHATLEDDLSRRDFTVNAAALSPGGKLIDPFGAQRDLSARVIRCVGEPTRRFQEDALRMFRAFRFSAQLDFSIEENTRAAINACACGARMLSAERVRSELEKILLSSFPERANGLFQIGLLEQFLCRNQKTDLSALRRVRADKLLRFAGLCAILLQNGSIQSCNSFLTALKLEKDAVRACTFGEQIFSLGMPNTELQFRIFISQYGRKAMYAAAAMGDSTGCEPLYLAALDDILAKNPCLSVGELSVRGKDLQNLGLNGAEIGRAQRFLLSHVLEFPQDNRPEILLRVLESM